MTAYTDDDTLDWRLLGSLGAGQPRTSQYTGTKALLLAVLEDGIRSYLSSARQVRSEAELWVGSCRQRSPFSFVVICETLGLEPGPVRRALQRMREQQRRTATRGIGRLRPNVRRERRLTG